MSSPAKQGHRGAKLTRDKRGGAKLTRNEHGDICNGANDYGGNDRSGDVLANANDRGDVLANANDRGDINGQDRGTCDEKHADNLRQNPHSADTVSYTHLDVYKRQAEYIIFAFIITFMVQFW